MTTRTSGNEQVPGPAAAGRVTIWLREATLWGLVAVALAAMVAGWALHRTLAARGLPSQEADLGTGIAFLAIAVLGAFLGRRRPDNALGWLFLAVGAVAGLSLFAPNYALYSVHIHDLPVTPAVGWAGAWMWFPTIGSVMTFFFLLFPTGRVPGPRWRWVFRMAVAAITAISLSFALRPGRLGEGESQLPIQNPLGVEAFGSLVDLLAVGGGILFAAVTLLSLASLIFRFRRGSGVERLQLKWFAFAAAINVVIIAIETLFPAFFESLPVFTIFGIQVLLLPGAAALAILRYRLYDIDVIINRTLVYGVLTGVLLASYLLIVVTLSRVLDPVTRDSDVAVAASTLAVAALFRPLRSRIQGFIDRRFYRSRYDSRKALQDFSARLRDEVEIDVVRDDILAVVRETLQPRNASLWLNASETR